MEVFLSPKIPKKFSCNACHYYTSNKKDYDKHLLTAKHQKMTIGSNLGEMEVTKIPTYDCECSKVFKTHGGLWKHKKRCGTDNFENNYNDISVPIIEYLQSKKYFVVINKSIDIFMIHERSIFYSNVI